MDSVSEGREPLRPIRNPLPLGTTCGKWVVIGEPQMLPKGGKPRVHYRCRCVCGTERVVLAQILLGTRARSCGCVRRPPVTHGESGTRLHSAWGAMLDRCRSPRNVNYAGYGGRGIVVCPEWADYQAFRDWAVASGHAEGLELDRRDNDGPYAPWNCRWVTRKEQCQNMRRNVSVTAFGETKCVEEWTRDPRCSVSNHCIRHRLRRGWPPEAAVSHPALHSRWDPLPF